MASVLFMCFLLSLVILHTRAELQKINLGSSLVPNGSRNSWRSASGHFAFGFYRQGNGFAVGIWLVDKPNFTVVWTANRDYPPVPLNSTIKFTKDGLHLRTAQGDEKAVVELFNQPASASMLDSGNFIIYGYESQVIWESFDNPTDTVLGGQSIYPQLMASRSTSDHSSGQFYIDVNYFGLVAYPVNHTGELPEDCYWNVPIVGTGYPSQLNLSLSGTLQLTRGNKTLQAIANSSYSATSKPVIYRATLDADGILRLYSHRFDINGNSNVTIEWSALINQCEVKGFCGFNSFCSIDSNKTDCYCFPGFDFIDPQEKFQGCNRNFTDEEGCQRKEPALVYNITNLEKTKLGGLAFEKQPMRKEDCSASCLNDCHCGGSRGYTAPEAKKHGSITVKSDVYSFGVVLLEIICCRSNMEVNVSTADEVLLPTWVYNCFVSRELNRLVAPEEVHMKTLERMVKVGLLCIQDEPNLRPSMKNVILMLEGTMDIPVPPCPSALVNT
ncbi:hypothetical protein Pint_27150 [Pistacia integerrima]|uniref:Uncharacterized protein n=1 Tax=Pistacia integerrima TaxID=434235 RepID=A0ACC0YQ99_9ROSI|nr:hypothetical protein Pint_27150 [Pistacia integerrima]